MTEAPPVPPLAPSPRRVLVLLVVLGLIWGSAYPVIHFGILRGATPVLFADVRYALSAAAFLAIAAAARIPRPGARSLALSAGLGIPIVGLYGLFLYVGEATTSGGLASVLIAAAPLMTALIALPILPSERLAGWGVLGLLVGFGGVAVLAIPLPGTALATSVYGPVEVLAAAASVAVGTVLLRVRRPEGESLWGVGVQFASATALLTVLLPLLEPHAALPLGRNVLLSLAYLVAMPSLAGYALYFYLHHHIGPGRANVVAYINPAAALSIGVLVFAEPFAWRELAGFALIAIGLTLVTRARGPAPTPAGGRT